jgi:hygromycin-B 7''-O-kinase
MSAPQLPQGLDVRGFDALHDDPSAWHAAMNDLVRAQGWAGDWRPAGEGTVLVALLGDEQVLKLFPPFLADHAAFEQGLMARLQGQLPLPTPSLLASGVQDGWPWTRMTQLPGQLLLARWPHMTEPARLALLRELGATARAVQALPVGEQAQRAPAWPDFIARQRTQCLARQQRTGLPAHLLAQVSSFLEGPLPSGPDVLLTGEYTPMNLLVDAQDRLCGMFDFGDGLIGPGAYDALGPLCFLCNGDRARVQAWFDGLQQVVPADPTPLLRLLLLHRYSHLPAQLASLPQWQDSPNLVHLAHRLLGQAPWQAT